ncbi:MAG TPA: hypothetical protein VFG95_09100 [Nitrospiria bacterium]|jgi:hypothetical protein|nr:hypothetical protein [Nitrospiria bacterium]
MDEVQAGREKFIEMLKEIDPEVQCVIPVRSTNDSFLISLSKGKARKFITISEDDIVDLVEDDLIRQDVESQIHEALKQMKQGH